MYCIAKDGRKMPDRSVRGLVLEADFETAYFVVCKYITKRDIEKLHKRIIKNVSRHRRTVDLAPRGFGKSTIGDVDYCITRILRNPDIRIMIGSKTQTQAEAFLKEIRQHFDQNEDLIRIFGDLKSDNWSSREFTVNNRRVIKKEATVTALGASGAVVSKHFDVIIGDDLVGFENARTEGQRKKLRDWFYSSLAPTLEPDGELHILGTRYHPYDLYQDFIDSGSYSVQVQQAIRRNSEGDEVSLWEDKFSLEKLKEIERNSGKIIFGMQYQNSTELAKGNIFKPEHFRYYEEYRIRDNVVSVCVKDEQGIAEWIPVKMYFGIDLAISQSQTADYFVLMAIGVDASSNIYVVDYVKERLSFDRQFNTILSYGELKYPMVERIGIETVAYQLSMAQALRSNSTLPIINIQTHKDKISRAMRRSALFENGKVYLRGDSMSDLEECLMLFPEVEHDDLFDALDFAITVQEQGQTLRVMDRSLFRI